ncbi:MAG: hypothetical protein R3191_07365 [Anaerolineales bacterium]|nr:hypothetical protein [Anaerolineales bacterium]
MQINCYRCNRSYSLSNEEIGFAVAALRAEDAIHYDAPCPHCRTKNRVSLEALEKIVRTSAIEVPDLDEDDAAQSEEG